MILPAQLIRKRCLVEPQLITPFVPRGAFAGMTFGLGPATYDCRIRQTMIVPRHGLMLASTIEKVHMPHDLRATVCDKSSWARRGLCVQNTKIDPGFRGHITLELTNHTNVPISLAEGMPICQLEFALLAEPTDIPYAGRYQDQPDCPVDYRPAKDEWR